MNEARSDLQTPARPNGSDSDHAPGGAINVGMTFRESAVTLTVTNTVTAEASVLASTGGGYGLRGMQERIELVGTGHHDHPLCPGAGSPRSATLGRPASPPGDEERSRS